MKKIGGKKAVLPSSVRGSVGEGDSSPFVSHQPNCRILQTKYFLLAIPDPIGETPYSWNSSTVQDATRARLFRAPTLSSPVPCPSHRLSKLRRSQVPSAPRSSLPASSRCCRCRS